MAVILVGSIKGGVGKSTTALALASEIRSAGQTVYVIDTDPQLSLYRWYEDWKLKDGIVVEDGHKMTQKQLETAVYDASQDYPFVILDVKGAINEQVMYATLQANMLIIPQRASAADLERSIEFLARPAEAPPPSHPVHPAHDRDHLASRARDHGADAPGGAGLLIRVVPGRRLSRDVSLPNDVGGTGRP